MGVAMYGAARLAAQQNMDAADAALNWLTLAAPQTVQAVPQSWREALLDEFPLLDDEGLDEDEHPCEWVLQQDRKRLHAMLAAAQARQHRRTPMKAMRAEQQGAAVPSEREQFERWALSNGYAYSDPHRAQRASEIVTPRADGGVTVIDADSRRIEEWPAGTVRKPLTREQRRAIFNTCKYEGEDVWEIDCFAIIDAVERAHGIKGE